MTSIVIAAACFWLCSALAVWRAKSFLGPIDDDRAEEPVEHDWPEVSIVVACRNEEEHVERSVRSLLAVDYPALEVVAINDRSDDRTGEILDTLATGNSRLRVVHITELPPGWLGKPHALHEGTQRAQGAWLLFTDADVYHDPRLLKRAIHRALERKLDLLTIIPHNETTSVWMKFFFTQAITLLCLALGFWTASRRRQSWGAMGAGAFLLVPRVFYDRIGGHEALRLAVVDDVSLAQLAKRSGGKTELLLSRRWCRVPWAPSVLDLYAVTKKNSFAVFLYRWSILTIVTLLVVFTNTVLPLVGLFAPALWPIAIVPWLSLAWIYHSMRPFTEAPTWGFLVHPFTVPLFLSTAWVSAMAITWRGGITWRDTFYPLAELRKQ